LKNKKILSLCPLFIFCSLSLHPLESRFTGLGIEANVHTREGIAAGSGLAFGFDLNRGFALGCKAAISYNFDTVAAIEPLVFFRYYLPFRLTVRLRRRKPERLYILNTAPHTPLFQAVPL